MSPKLSAKLTIVFFIFATLFASIAGAEQVAKVKVSPYRIEWKSIVKDVQLALTVSGFENSYFNKTFDVGIPASFELVDNSGNLFPDGSCTYELTVIPVIDPELREVLQEARESGDTVLAAEIMKERVPQEPLVQSGYFLIQDGAIVMGDKPYDSELSDQDGGLMKEDVLHYDDVIITGSLCTGFDCHDGESFGFDTHILKEHNLRIYFNDTSYTASYPTNNWRITINDSTNGGASYFSIDDVDDGTSIFKLEAGAPSNSLYVEDYGRVGLGTSTPVVELHIKDSDTPTVRLEQDSSGGWTAQTWDVAGNESNFFVRDATNGSKLPFRIQPSTPSSTLCLKSDGKVGIGTWSPGYSMELETTGENATFFLERTSGAQMFINATANHGNFGTVNNYPTRIVCNSDPKVWIESGGDVGIGIDNPTNKLHVVGNIYATGTITPGSSRDLKENIEKLTAKEAMQAFRELNPIKFNYKANKEELNIGFIAEDVPDLVAMKGRKGVNTMDIVAVLTKVVQEQQKTISQLTEKMTKLENELKLKQSLALASID